MSLTFYPEIYSRRRPYFVEIKDGKKFQLFKANYLGSEEDYVGHPLKLNGEVHPWNLGVEGEFEEGEIISFWTRSFVSYMVDALNDKHESNYHD